MTHEEKIQLAEMQGFLNFALWWSEAKRDMARENMTTQSDPFFRGVCTGTASLADDVIGPLKNAIALLEPLRKGTSHE